MPTLHVKTRMTKVNYKLRVYLGLGRVLPLVCGPKGRYM